jgi:microcin C transport system substrate-binding protein
VFETLLTGTMDEPTTGYGLLAEDVEVASDRLSVAFRLNPAARFSDGKPVMAADVKHSFDTLMSKQAAPQYRVVFGDVKQAVVTGERSVRFDFHRANAELPLLVGGLPIFSRAWGAGKPFDQVVMEMPVASGPYRIGRLNFGRDISYERRPDYWGWKLGVRRGTFNFDRITYKIYKDTTAQTEAFKAGEFDYLRTFSAREWARTYVGKKFDSGELIKAELPVKNAGDFQGFLINTRRDKFKDARVRQALGLAFDFEWMNRQLMYNSYTRCRGFFNGSDFEAKGLPGQEELALLNPLRDKLPARVFDEAVPLPPSTNPPSSLRGNLRKARELLAAAGWTYRDGALRNPKGEPFTVEYLDSGGGERLITPYFQALGRLGIAGEYRRADFALIQKRLDVFDFDLFTVRVPGREAPGSELFDRFGSESADTEGSGNLIGVKNPAVDTLVKLAVSSTTRPQLIARLRALDRVLRHGYYVVPQYYSSTYRIAYRSGKFEQPARMPLYYQAEDWVISTWWRKG